MHLENRYLGLGWNHHETGYWKQRGVRLETTATTVSGQDPKSGDIPKAMVPAPSGQNLCGIVASHTSVKSPGSWRRALLGRASEEKPCTQ